eukprot:scaffold8118_cov20-Tisochrysis_lutea.AAC.1
MSVGSINKSPLVWVKVPPSSSPGAHRAGVGVKCGANFHHHVGTKLEPVQNAERMFTITPSQYELFKKRPNHKLQVTISSVGPLSLAPPCLTSCCWMFRACGKSAAWVRQSKS